MGEQQANEPKAYVDEIQPTMARTVEWLQDRGFDTCDSGDGVLNVEAGMEGALEFAHVFCRVRPAFLLHEADRLWSEVRARGLDRDERVAVEASYSPRDGVALLGLYYVDDAALEAGRG